MPRIPTVSRSTAFLDPTSITCPAYLEFLLPSLPVAKRRDGDCRRACHNSARRADTKRVESVFFTALSQAALCRTHRGQGICHLQATTLSHKSISSLSSGGISTLVWRKKREHAGSALTYPRPSTTTEAGRERHGSSWHRAGAHTHHGQAVKRAERQKQSKVFQPKFAAGSHLPRGFYADLENIQTTLRMAVDSEDQKPQGDSNVGLEDQLKLLESVRDLEEKLATAKAALHKSLAVSTHAGPHPSPVVLTKEDYLNLVDLYFYSHQSRFEPDSPDHSPTPLFLDDYSFQLSADFSRPDMERQDRDEERDEDVSPLKHVEEMLKSRQLHEISVMQAFIELLLDDFSSNRALFEVYKKFPDPGVASLPRGVIRLFLQRMSTPWVKSEKTMLRYLSLIDDMQRAALPITSAEWSSAIYLAGRSFSSVTESEVATSFRIWREMEQNAGVKSNHVTFNILFDIAVRAGKYVLGQTILKEMYDRGLRLNRLGRVSLIYYHGLRGDGDGVRKAYRDFVEAGEIVDTLVLNCVMASLINTQEPVAAEQVYERMKNLQARLQKGRREDGEEVLFMKYPPPGSDQINMEI